VDGLAVPIYVAFLADSELDDADGDADLLAARIAAELSDERATVLVVGLLDEGIGSTGAVRDLGSRPRADPDEFASAAAVDYVRALQSTEVEDATAAYSSETDGDGSPLVVIVDTAVDPRTLAYPAGAAVGGIGLGLLVGGGLGIGGVLVRRRIREK